MAKTKKNDPELGFYERVYLRGLDERGRMTKEQLRRYGMPNTVITELLKRGILVKQTIGSTDYYRVNYELTDRPHQL
jgi:hypothetical protein